MGPVTPGRGDGTDRTPPTVTPTTPIGPDVDLDAEDVRLTDGTRLTEQKASEIVGEVRRRAGRPSLTGEAAISPRISFRITPGVRDQAAEIAAREGKTVSQLAREALEARVARDGGSSGRGEAAMADGEGLGRP